MIRNALAVVLGVALAMVLIMAVEYGAHTIYPPPTDLDFQDMEAMSAYVSSVPAGALLLVLAAWVSGTIGGGLLACFVAKKNSALYAGIIGGLVLLGTLYNFSVIPHPTWFAVLSVVVILVVTWLTGQFGAKFVPLSEEH